MRAFLLLVVFGIIAVPIALAGIGFPASASATASWFRPAPGPLIGFGLPLAGAAFAALYIVRRFRPKD